MQFSQPSARNFHPEAPKLPSGSAIVTTKSLFFKKRIQKLRWTVKWSFGNPVQSFWQKFKNPKNEIFSETIFFSNYSSGLVCAFLTNPSTFYAKNWNSFARSPRKNKKLLLLVPQKQVHHCKYFPGYVESSFGKPFPPINTFLPDIPKSINGNPRKFKKAHFFPKNFLKNIFPLKNVLWTRRMQFEKTIQYFSSKTRKTFAEKSKID